MSNALPLIKAAAAGNEMIAIEAKAIITPVEAAEDGKQKGRPSVAINAYNGGVIRVAGYYRPVAIDIAGLSGLGKPIPLYRSHDANRIVGHGTAQRENNSLAVSGKLSANNADTQEIIDLAAEDFPWQASVGVQPLRLEQVEAGSTITVNGQPVSGPATIVRAGRLYEVSIVSNGADDTTSTKIAAKLTTQEEKPVGFDAWLTAKGFIKAELSDSQLTSLKAMFESEQKTSNNDGGSTVDEVLRAARARDERQAAYGRIISAAIDRGMDTETAERLVKAASNDNLTETEFELQVLRATRHEGSSRASSQHGNVSAEIIEAALARSIGTAEIEAAYKPEVLEASERQFKHGLSMVELMMMTARRNGHREISHRDIGALLKAAFAPVQAAGASTYDLGGVLSNVANKMIKAGFDSVEQEWRKVAAVRPVNDLKEHKSYALTGDFEYKEVGKGGELTHATMSEEEYSNRAKTHGRMFSITEDDLINDDLGAFTRVRNLIGRGGALAFNKAFWTEFLADVATFYTEARKNYIEGAATALDVDSLSTGFTTFEAQVDPDGNPMGMTPSVLVVPTALKIKANSLANDPEIRISGASNKSYTTSNPHAGKLEVAASTYLNNAQITGGSATHWFLLANPMDMPLIEAVFLYGQQAPRVDAAEAAFNVLGIQMRGTFRFGMKKQEYRAGFRSKGAA